MHVKGAKATNCPIFVQLVNLLVLWNLFTLMFGVLLPPLLGEIVTM